LNAVISLLLVAGLSVVAFEVLWLDLISDRSFIGSSAAAILIFFACAISILSRGQFVFQILALVLSLYANRLYVTNWSARRFALILIFALGLLAASVPMVNAVRGIYYPHAAAASQQTVPSEAPPSPAYMPRTPPWGSTWLGPAKPDPFTPVPPWLFVIERWIGIEGVMSVESYKPKGLTLWISAATERAELGKATLYQTISHSHYPGMDLTKYSFATLPGAVAFFYLSGSMLLVFSGVVTLAFVMQGSELMAAKLARNPLLTAFWGSSMASVVSQFGLTPRGLIPYLTFCGILFVGVASLRSRWLARIAARLGA
jgi:hypothetical protein